MQVTLEPDRPERILDWIIAEKCDVGLTADFPGHPAVHARRIPVRTVCILPPGHPLAAQDEIVPTDLRHERVIHTKADDPFFQSVQTAFQQFGVTLATGMETRQFGAACRLVAEGFGVSIVSVLDADEFGRTGIVSRPFFPRLHHNLDFLQSRLSRSSMIGLEFIDAFVASLSHARATWSLELYAKTGQGSLLDIALDTLSQGCAHAALARGTGADADAHRDKGRARLDAAVDGLRNAGLGENIVRGLLARAAFHRQSGNPDAARADLRAVLDAATRSEMRLYLIDARIEEALQWLTLPPDGPDQRPSLNAHSALEAAAALIKATGLKRREADIALVSARLALAERAPEIARTALAEAIRLIGEKGWWGLLPDLAELIETGGFDDLRPDLDRLQAAAASYHRKADAAWRVHDAYAAVLQQRERQRPAQPAGPSDAQLDQMLANPQVRAKLAEILTANGIDTPLDDMPREAQRDILRQVIAAQSKDQ